MKRKASIGECHRHSRKRSYRLHKRAKLRETVGILDPKESLNVALLNVDGLKEAQFNIVNSTISSKSPDICVILETKFRKEQVDINVKIDGYEYIDRRRSNASLDRPGGCTHVMIMTVVELMSIFQLYQTLIMPLSTMREYGLQSNPPNIRRLCAGFILVSKLATIATVPGMISCIMFFNMKSLNFAKLVSAY